MSNSNDVKTKVLVGAGLAAWGIGQALGLTGNTDLANKYVDAASEAGRSVDVSSNTSSSSSSSSSSTSKPSNS